MSARSLLRQLQPQARLGKGGIAFVALLAATYLWVLLTPIVPAVSEAGMKRFNLSSNSYAAWALQQPVPSMYNFSNEVCFGPETLLPRLGMIQLNHYPPRAFTFLDREEFDEALPIVLKGRSSYQGRHVEVKHRFEPAPSGGLRMVAMSDLEADD